MSGDTASEFGPDPLGYAVAILARIRRDGDWESAQTHESLLPYLIEEAWELVDAVADGDRAELRSELGDLLLQVLFHAAIAAEDPDDPFTIDDVAVALLAKLRRRAPYWFDDHAGSRDGGAGEGRLSAEEQDRLWQAAKEAEKVERSGGERGTGSAAPRSCMDGISWQQPALALGEKVLGRAVSAGVPEDLIPEEVRTVRVALPGSDGVRESPEVAYRSAVRRFAARVRAAERAVLEEEPRTTADRADAWRRHWGEVENPGR